MSADLDLQFSPDQVWRAIQALLTGTLGDEINVDCVGEKDYDEQGSLTIVPPAARVLFLEEISEAVESQNLNYRSKQKFAVLVADADLSSDAQVQRDKSILLARMVKLQLTGARLTLNDGTTSDPVRCLGLEPLRTAEIGLAYVVGFEVEGMAYFPGPNRIAVNPGVPL
jgi:hypothetical protein